MILLWLIVSLSSWGGVHKSLVGPARAQWPNRHHIQIKTPVAISGDFKFLIKSSQQEISLGIDKSEFGMVTLRVPPISDSDFDELVTQDLRLVIRDSQDRIIDQTLIQWAGMLDDVYADSKRPLGLKWSAKEGQLSVWAPTARKVDLNIYNREDQNEETPAQTRPMIRQRGFWSTSVPLTAKNQWYLYRVELFDPLSQKVRINYVTDPYSLNVSTNSSKSQLADLDSPDLMPQNWSQLKKPKLESFKDIVILETHLRDLTSNDLSLDEKSRGTYVALTQTQSDSAKHLLDLAKSGLTHIHFLPLNDFATVNEDKARWASIPLARGPWKDSPSPQSEMEKIRENDEYNWGYDPVHWMSPEGSYSTMSSPKARIIELRQMIMSLNKMGLRMVMDVVFNHTYADGDVNYSVLDRLVPLYYYRYDDEGLVQRSSCCADTASENAMMERLIIDSVVHWATAYKVDGFRFDLMCFHSRSTMEKVKARLRALTEFRDGVDGSKIYLYGEAWQFGSLFAKSPQLAMTQVNSYGSGFGVFNDRLRDALRGGTTNNTEKSDQGFLTGLFFDFNQEPANRNTPTDLWMQREKLLYLRDVVKIGMAGNLRDFSFIDRNGYRSTGGSVLFHGTPTGYSAAASETINYVSAHDGYSLWDAIQAKMPFHTPGRAPATATLKEKVRTHWLALGTVMLAQGIPFFEGGSEILRSKSGDVDSYDSGDWFNSIDWSFTSNNSSVGLPPSWKNKDDWSFWGPRLQDLSLNPGRSEILQTREYFKALLALRKRLNSWRFETSQEMMMHSEFLIDRINDSPGVIAFKLKNQSGNKIILLNIAPLAQSFHHEIIGLQKWRIAPELTLVDSELSTVLWLKDEIVLPPRTLIVLEDDL